MLFNIFNMGKLYIIIIFMQMIKVYLKKNLVLLIECVSHNQIVTKIISAVPYMWPTKKEMKKRKKVKVFLWEFSTV